MDMLHILFENFDNDEAFGKLESAMDWKDKKELENWRIEKFISDLEKLDPKMLEEFNKIMRLKQEILEKENEIYFIEGLKEGIKFMSKCMD